MAALADKTVAVVTTNGKTFNGTLIGINPDNMSLCLADAMEGGKQLHRIVLNGAIVAQISTADKPFDLKSLAGQTRKSLPNHG